MSEEELERLERLADGATRGPWKSDTCGDVWTIASEYHKWAHEDDWFFSGSIVGSTRRGPDNGDASFIASSRTAIPALISALRAERQKSAKLVEFVNIVLQQDRSRGYPTSPEWIAITKSAALAVRE